LIADIIERSRNVQPVRRCGG